MSSFFLYIYIKFEHGAQWAVEAVISMQGFFLMEHIIFLNSLNIVARCYM